VTHYTEQPSTRGTTVTLVLYGLFLIWVYAEDVVSGTFEPSSLALVPAFGLVALPFAVLPLSKRRYHGITLTADTLRVGRASLPATGLSLVDGPPPPGTPLLGGAYGVPMGYDVVVVEGADKRQWRIATRRPAELSAALA